MYAGVSSVSFGIGDQSFGGLGKCSVTTQCNFGHPLKAITSPAVVFGKPLRQASDVNAIEMLQLPNKNPIC